MPIAQLSANAFKTVMDIDVLGSFNTLKATLPHLLKSAAANHSDGKIRTFTQHLRSHATLIAAFS